VDLKTSSDRDPSQDHHDRLNTLQAAINKELRDMGHTHLTVTLSPGVFENFASMECHHLDSDSVSTGFFGNFFLFGKANEEQQREINTQLHLIQSGHNSVSHTDAKDLLKLSVNLPTKTSPAMSSNRFWF
jgi:hypothetical protein